MSTKAQGEGMLTLSTFRQDQPLCSRDAAPAVPLNFSSLLYVREEDRASSASAQYLKGAVPHLLASLLWWILHGLVRHSLNDDFPGVMLFLKDCRWLSSTELQYLQYLLSALSGGTAPFYTSKS
ncbi:hypothetical protein TREES_T100008900 [Tupaia chinensis]|uniref:Uncharacterized protein n=1 Tax=Tupaia chinensis TaxID=246437 RepID=L9L0F3_TUPCH|nr:hypothetical protein TREES_T100008900 [Tupaia chinensis]